MSFQPSDWCIKQNPNQNDFTGIIVGVNDPHQNNRAQVRIPFLHKGVPDEMLPWYQNGNIQKNVKGETEIKIPVLGSTVKVAFENDDFYTGTFYDGYKAIQDIDQDYMADGNITGYGNFDGHKDQWGNWWKVGNDGTVTFKTNQGVLIEIFNNRDVRISGTQNITVDNEKKITFNTEDFILNCRNSCTINPINTYTLNTINSTVNATTSAITNSTLITENAPTVTVPQDKLILGTGGSARNVNSGHKHMEQGDGNPTSGVL